MHRHLAALTVTLALHACALKGVIDTGSSPGPSEFSDPLAQAVDRVTDHLFNEAQPALTQAVSKLPPEAQALVQAAYVALQQAIDVAAARGIAALDIDAHAEAVDALGTIAQVADVLHAAVHEPDARAPMVGAPSMAADPSAPVRAPMPTLGLGLPVGP